MSIRATTRMTGVSKVTILKLLLDVGRACINFEEEALRNLPCSRIQADEIWGFSRCKAKRVRPEHRNNPDYGDVWTWTAICSDTKLICSWLMGDRDGGHAHAFMCDLASRLVARPQLTTDALGIYAGAVLDAFERLGVDYAQVQKIYAKVDADDHRYSPPQCIACEKRAIFGRCDSAHISTSYVERSNLTIRMSQRRWTRLTNAHSKSFRHMEAAFALHSCYYNWARKHMSLECQTPAMAAGLIERAWTIADIVVLLENQELHDRLASN